MQLLPLKWLLVLVFFHSTCQRRLIDTCSRVVYILKKKNTEKARERSIKSHTDEIDFNAAGDCRVHLNHAKLTGAAKKVDEEGRK